MKVEHRGIGTGLLVGVVIAVILAVVAGYFLVTNSLGGNTSTSTSTTQTSTTSSRSSSTSSSSSTLSTPNVARVLIPKGAGSITSINYNPASIRVVLGMNNTVVWTNDDPVLHTVTSTSVPIGASAFDSSTFSQGQTYQITLTAPGTYKYYCTLHPWMIAEIIVVAP